MPFTSTPGTVLSYPSNTIPGLGVKVQGQIALTGVVMAQVGPEYDFAMGYDPGTGTAQMFGYCITETGTWTEATQLQDIQRLVQVASASTTDRDLTIWPKVSQGDWTTGERQVIFVDPSRYYSSDGGMDVTTTAALKLLPSPTVAHTIAPGDLGGANLFPLATDGDQWYLGTPAGSVIVGHRDGTTTTIVINGGAHEVGDLTVGLAASVPGVWAATAVGIWFIDGVTYSVTQWVGGPVEILSTPCQAYADGRLYYVVGGGGSINFVTAAGGTAGTVGITPSPMEGLIHALATTSAGIMWSTEPADRPGIVPQGYSLLFEGSSDLTNPARVGTIPGIVKYIQTSEGTTYILAHLAESVAPLQYNPTLHTWNGTALTIFDDMRYALPDFQANVAALSSYMSCSVAGDGRFVYVAWPGLQVLQLDLINPTKGTGVSRVAGTGLPGTTVLGHCCLRTRYHGYVDMSVNTLGGSVQTFSAPPTSGTLTTSYFDLDTPSLIKYYRSLDIDLAEPLPAGSRIDVSFQADAATTWTPLMINANSLVNLVAYFPFGVKATRVRYQITITAGNNGASPVIRAYATKANLGRVWTTTVSCKRRQQTNLGRDDQQGALAQDLIGNIENAYANAGRCILYVPNPAQKGVEQVVASLEDYKWTVNKPAPRQNEQMAEDIEGDVEVVFSEII